MSDPAVTYGSYLAIDELLALQRPRSEGPEHDEMLFIVIHQVYELWFKEILHELDQVMRWLEAGDAYARPAHDEAHPDHPEGAGRAARHPRDDDAAGIPVLQGTARGRERVPVGPVPPARVHARSQGARRRRALPGEQPRPDRRCGRRFAARTLWDAFVHYLAREGYRVPAEHPDARRDAPVAASEALQDVLIEVYRTDARNAELCERLVDLDEGLQEWRYRHVKMVQRTIGDAAGHRRLERRGYLSHDADAAAVSRPVGHPREALRGSRPTAESRDVTNEQLFGATRHPAVQIAERSSRTETVAFKRLDSPAPGHSRTPRNWQISQQIRPNPARCRPGISIAISGWRLNG